MPQWANLSGSCVRCHDISTTIVFHGDGDAAVAASNADLIVDQAVQGFISSSGQTLEQRRSTVAAGRGRAATVTRTVDDQGRTRVEQWRGRR